jgi:hypothetical protein
MRSITQNVLSPCRLSTEIKLLYRSGVYGGECFCYFNKLMELMLREADHSGRAV